MDTLNILRSKIDTLARVADYPGVSAVLQHIEIAESYFHRALAEDEQFMFTDVIYRTNHAFEGALKEAYTVLEGADAAQKTPHQIEQYLATSDVFRPRVMELFTNYRTQWRNPSTHDYQLAFNEQEAFLSILSVTSFVSILLDQMIEKVALTREAETTKDKVGQITASIPDFSSLTFPEKVSQLLLRFSEQLRPRMHDESPITEREIIGEIQGFLISTLPRIEIIVEQLLRDGLRPDLELQSNGEKVLVEISRWHGRRKLRETNKRLLMYLEASGIDTGILYVAPVHREYEMLLEESTVEFGGTERKIFSILPDKADNSS
jgi:hypothetical protein